MSETGPISTITANGNIRADILAYTAITGLLGCLCLLMFHVVPAESHDFIVYALGALTVIVKDVYGFEFGSSRSSHDKDDTIASLTK